MAGAYKCEWVGSGISLELETDAPFRLDHPQFHALITGLSRMATGVDYTAISVSTSEPLQPQPVYTVTITHRDNGNSWDETLTYDQMGDPAIALSISAPWRRNEVLAAARFVQGPVHVFVANRKLIKLEVTRE